MFIYYIFGINTVAVWIFWFYIWGQGITNILVHFSCTICVYCDLFGNMTKRTMRDQSEFETTTRSRLLSMKIRVGCCLLPLVPVFFPVYFSCLTRRLDRLWLFFSLLYLLRHGRCVEQSWKCVGNLWRASGMRRILIKCWHQKTQKKAGSVRLNQNK